MPPYFSRIKWFLLINCISLAAVAQDFDYLPVAQSDLHVLTFEEFTLSYNNHHRQANWVAYALTAEELDVARKRKDYFAEAKHGGTMSAALSDYKYSGFDRGHLCRAQFCKNSLKAYRQSFLLSNISPQIGVNFNRTGGIWYELEELEIALAYKYGEVYAVSGPVFKDNLGAIGANAVTIPGYFFKAIFIPDHQEGIGFLLRHEATAKKPLSFAISIDSLEAFTGIDFYPALEDEVENVVEASVDLLYWQPGEESAAHYRSSSTTTVQCQAITKTTGNQCRRKTTDISHYCWQHRGSK